VWPDQSGHHHDLATLVNAEDAGAVPVSSSAQGFATVHFPPDVGLSAISPAFVVPPGDGFTIAFVVQAPVNSQGVVVEAGHQLLDFDILPGGFATSAPATDASAGFYGGPGPAVVVPSKLFFAVFSIARATGLRVAADVACTVMSAVPEPGGGVGGGADPPSVCDGWNLGAGSDLESPVFSVGNLPIDTFAMTRSGGGGSALGDDVAEALFVVGSLDAPQYWLLVSYFSQKYGIPLFDK
jgi:hypothetical protein